MLTDSKLVVKPFFFFFEALCFLVDFSALAIYVDSPPNQVAEESYAKDPKGFEWVSDSEQNQQMHACDYGKSGEQGAEASEESFDVFH
jgi:hypothetical protein